MEEIKSVKPSKIQIDPSKLLTKLPRYPWRPDTMQSLTPVKVSKSGTFIPYTHPCNMCILPIKKPIEGDGDLYKNLKP